MRLVVDAAVWGLFPEVRVGVVVARGIDNTGAAAGAAEAVAGELRRAEEAARRRFAGRGGGEGGGDGGSDGAGVGGSGGSEKAALAADPRIACWREAYGRFGGNPKKNPVSVEALLRRVVLRGAQLGPINALVDLYNAVSIERVLPVGGEDLAAVRGDIELARAGANEPAVLLLGDAEARPPHPGEVIYRDAVSALCRRWNWKEAERTKLTAATRDAVLVLEGLPPIGEAELREAVEDLAARIRRHCGGEVRTAMLDPARPAIEL